MFNSSHTLIGVAIARTGSDQAIAYATTTAVIAANLMDIDIVAGLAGTPAYLDYHRGITHTFIGIPILSLVIAAAMWKFSGNLWKTFWLALVVMLSHLGLDYSNAYGLRPFLPFSGKWYYGDTLFIIDPYFDFILLIGILAGRYLKNARAIFAWTSIVIVLGYIAMRVELRNDAHDLLDSFTRSVPGFERSAVSPVIDSPFIWTGIVETKTDVFSVEIDTRTGISGEITRMKTGYFTDITQKAEAAPSAASLLAFARFPTTRVEGVQSGYRVTFADFRFYREATHSALAAEVLLDRSLRVVQDSLSFNHPMQ